MGLGLRGVRISCAEGGLIKIKIVVGMSGDDRSIGQSGSAAPAPSMLIDPQRVYDSMRAYSDAYMAVMPPSLSQPLKDALTHTEAASTHEVAALFRRVSGWLWQQHEWAQLFTSFGFHTAEKQIPIQKEYNNKLVVLNGANEPRTVTSDDFTLHFEAGKETEWPNLVLTANHARAWQGDDLVEMLDGVKKLSGDAAVGFEINEFPTHTLVSGEHTKAPGKTIFALACYTEKDVFLNGAELIDRRIALHNDEKGNADPAQRSIKHMSPAAMRLAKLILKLMVEPNPDHAKLVDLDRSEPDGAIGEIARFSKDPRVVADHHLPLTLRADAAKIAQHIKLIGYSKGANTVTDALRFLYLEFAGLKEQDRLKIRENGQERPVTPKDLEYIMNNIGLLSLAPGEVPLTAAEKKIGIKRTTILNTNDLTAGHLVNPDEKDYDRWYDRLIKVEGTEVGSGHSITEALGSARHGKVGFIMKASNDPHFIAAQDEVRSFVASNIGVNAATTVCLSPEGADNILLVQFAPGVTRAEERKLMQEFKSSLQVNGFPKLLDADIESDLAGRRRLRIVLDHDAIHRPIVSNEDKFGPINGCNHTKVKNVKAALEAVNHKQGNGLYLIHDVAHYMDGLLGLPDKAVGAESVLGGRVKERERKRA